MSFTEKPGRPKFEKSGSKFGDKPRFNKENKDGGKPRVFNKDSKFGKPGLSNTMRQGRFETAKQDTPKPMVSPLSRR